MGCKTTVYTFRCPVCEKRFRSEEPGEPLCTGPSEMRDDHEHTIMHLHSRDTVEVHPLAAALRADGPLFTPGDIFHVMRERAQYEHQIIILP